MGSTTELDWFTSSYSGSSGDSCVEVAPSPGTVHVRDPKDTAGPRLALSLHRVARVRDLRDGLTHGCGQAGGGSRDRGAERVFALSEEESPIVDILLIAGLWLDASAWDDVVPPLEALGHRPVPLTLPGQGDGSASATLDDQVAAIVAAVDSASGPALVVGHSAACTLAWLAADARPEKVARVALVGGFPHADGEPYADFFPTGNGAMPFPGWEPFEGPDAADLDDEARRGIASAALPVPVAVTKGTVRLADERRFDVPVTVVCPEFSPAQAREWIDAGDAPELGRVKDLAFADIDSGHWPMFTRPAELARLLGETAGAEG